VIGSIVPSLDGLIEYDLLSIIFRAIIDFVDSGFEDLIRLIF
jgi:hypothetical protein